jgi:hypothetical protein
VLDDIRQLLGPAFEELAGARLGGEIPISERVVNRFIADRLRASDGAVESAEVQLRANDELAVRVRLRRPRFAPTVIVALRIEQQPDLAAAPVLVLRWWLPGMGALAALARPALGFLKTTPPGVTLDGDRITLDVPRLLRERGAGEVLDYLAALRINTRDRVLLIGFELRVKEPYCPAPVSN